MSTFHSLDRDNESVLDKASPSFCKLTKGDIRRHATQLLRQGQSAPRQANKVVTYMIEKQCRTKSALKRSAVEWESDSANSKATNSHTHQFIGAQLQHVYILCQHPFPSWRFMSSIFSARTCLTPPAAPQNPEALRVDRRKAILPCRKMLRTAWP